MLGDFCLLLSVTVLNSLDGEVCSCIPAFNFFPVPLGGPHHRMLSLKIRPHLGVFASMDDTMNQSM